MLVFRAFLRRLKMAVQLLRYSFPKGGYVADIPILDIQANFPDLNDQYLYFYHYYLYRLPKEVRAHRRYFLKNERGYGEDAFHAMWYLIFKHFRPKSALEIGVYRGQVISLWALLAKHFNAQCDVHGISPFTELGDSVSAYPAGIDYYADTMDNFRYFELSLPSLHVGLSSDKTLVAFIKSKEWDLVYVDGGHDYGIVLADVENCSFSLSEGGLLVLDDSALFTEYKGFPFSSLGHPGPSQVAKEMEKFGLREILSVGHNRVFIKHK